MHNKIMSPIQEPKEKDTKKGHWECHLIGSLMSACISFPLWKAAAVGQSGFDKQMAGGFARRWLDSLKPPYRGVIPVLFGMTWARAFIFFSAEQGRRWLEANGVDNKVVSVALPPILASTFVQIMNQPIVRGSITIQDPKSKYTSVVGAMRAVYQRQGPWGLWHGTSAGVMKTVPKYVTAIAVKDAMEHWLPKASPDDRTAVLARSATKAVAAGLAGAILTNPLDVLRNTMFATDLGVKNAFNKLIREEGMSFATRGMTKNIVAVSIPVAATIFFTDWLIRVKERSLAEKQGGVAAAAAKRKIKGVAVGAAG